MRYSKEKKANIDDYSKSRKNNLDFLSDVFSKTTARERQCSLLFAGGRSLQDITIRQAQAPLRLDRLASYWSHIALITDWPDATALPSGLEVSLRPDDPRLQVPERNGVTQFSFRKYRRQSDFPNLAIATIDFEISKDATSKGSSAPKKGAASDTTTPPADAKELMLAAASEPNRIRSRFQFWNWLAPWSAYLFATESNPNPIIQGIALPGASFCEYVFEQGGIDLTPGATSGAVCPEMLWSTLLYWSEHIGQDHARRGKATFKIFATVRDPRCTARKPLPPTIDTIPNSAGNQQ